MERLRGSTLSFTFGPCLLVFLKEIESKRVLARGGERLACPGTVRRVLAPEGQWIKLFLVGGFRQGREMGPRRWKSGTLGLSLTTTC